MRIASIFAGLLVASMLLNACYKDKGNYSYEKVDAPAIASLDTVYKAIVGDSLIIDPGVSISNSANLSLQWRIGGPDLKQDLVFEGKVLRTIFGLDAKRYSGRLIVTNNDNGMKYFRNFFIDGITDFSVGATVLSIEEGHPQLSFVKNDGTIRARVYEAINGEPLPANPICLIGAIKENLVPRVVRRYWVISNDGKEGGVEIDPNNFKKLKSLAANYFDPPATLSPSYFTDNPSGTIHGIVDGKFVWGYDLTWDQAPIYGMFGVPLEGDYELSPHLISNYATGTFYIGYDVKKKSFLRINLYGTPVYFGTSYETITTTNAFDPKNTGLDLIHLAQVNNQNCYAFGRDAAGVLYELRFTVNFTGPFTFTPGYKKQFKQPELITAKTKWVNTNSGIFFFSSGSKIYRYNPDNETFQALSADFAGKDVTMIKLIDQNTLVAGTEGKLLYLDVRTGVNGTVIKTVEGIPGTPMDLYQRN